MPDSDSGRWSAGRIVSFVGIGLLLYLALFLWSERLVARTGDRNPFFRIERAEAQQDWLILGASHAMPLAFDDTEASIEAATGKRLLNLAATGTGPFVWEVAARRFFVDHGASQVLVVVDAFAFRDRRWNRDRIGDSDLMPRIPWDRRTLGVFVHAVTNGLPTATLADYLSGFSKINNRDRFKPDTWEAESRFDTAPRPSDAADKARFAYLYPGPAEPGAEAAAFDSLAAQIALAREHGAKVTLLRPPLPDRFRKLLPEETAFSARLASFAQAQGVPLADMSSVVPDPKFYFDPDHLNRTGVEAWLDAGLRDLIAGDDRRQ